MQYGSTQHSIDDLLEGSPPDAERREARSPLATSLNPIVSIGRSVDASPAEGCIVSAVEGTFEGKDNDEGQDASLTHAEATPSAKPEPVAAARPLDRAPLVLIVEDTLELAEVIQATLERMQMVTLHETHGSKAISALDAQKPDVVLLDIALPDMTGWKILDAIKEKYGEDAMPAVIVITAYGDPANRLVGKLQGVFSYLIKPFTSDEVEQIVTQALTSAV
jgi:CheY-like chemotaxis protein